MHRQYFHLMQRRLQKYAARKAGKFEKQGHRLLLPHLEMAYHFLCITRAPKHTIIQKMLPDVEAAVETVRGPHSPPRS